MTATATHYDFHIHTAHLRCANETMSVPAILDTAEQLGVAKLGIADHLNTLEKLPLQRRIREDLLASSPAMQVYFGVELNFLGCDGEFAFNPEVKEELGFQFAIGGIHATYCAEYDLSKIIDVQHRHHLHTCENALVDVFVHPYWFGKGEFDRNEWPWFDSVRPVPESYARELGQTAKATGTAIEINACANLCNPGNAPDYVDRYAEYLAAIAAEGAMFSLGSDAHDIGHLRAIKAAWQMVERLGLSEDRIWTPCGEPFVG